MKQLCLCCRENDLFSQRPGVDYDETFSPVTHLSSVRLIFALAVHRLKLRQLDVIGAFLQADLEEEIYMRQPESYIVDNVSLVCRLKKSLYGLKQAGLVGNDTINTLCDKLKLTRLNSCTGNVMTLMALSTDDILIAYDIDQITRDLSNRFPITDLGQPIRLLGKRITITETGIHLDQEAYISEILKRFDMKDCKGSDTPAQPGHSKNSGVCTFQAHNVSWWVL